MNNMSLNAIVIIFLIFYFIFCVIKKISFKITAVISVIFFIVTAGFLILGDENFANSIATIFYYLLIVSVGLAAVEYFREIYKTKRS